MQPDMLKLPPGYQPVQPKIENPLRQYFRRPALYFRLPSGGVDYAEGVVDIPPNGELPVYPMTSNDEVTMRTPDALLNGAAMVDVIRSCIPNILDPWQINNIDFDAIVIAMRAASVGNEMEISSSCPECSEENKFDIDLMSLLVQVRSIDFSKTMNVRELEIKFRPLTYQEMNQNNMNQFELQHQIAGIANSEETPENQKKLVNVMSKMNSLLLDVITNTIEFIRTPDAVVSDRKFILDFLTNCDKKTADTIKKESIAIRESNEIKPFRMKCIKCAHEYEQRVILNNSDFFEVGS
jgi:hypothetical protein